MSVNFPKNPRKLVYCFIVLTMITSLITCPRPALATDAVDQFVAKYNNTWIYNHGAQQCVALANAWNEQVVGSPFVITNVASDWYVYFDIDPYEPKYYSKISVTSGQPQRGDLAVWSAYPGTGGLSHIALVVDPLSGNSISCFTQNPSAAHVETLTRTGLLGYLRPKNLNIAIPPGPFTVSCKSTFYSNEDVVLNWTTSSNAVKYGLTVRKADTSIVFDDYVYGNQRNMGKYPVGSYNFAMAGYNSAGTMGPVSNRAYFSVVAASSDATLKGLTVSSGSMTPAFASGTTAYTVKVANNVSSINFTPTVNESHATVKVNGISVASGSASGAINLYPGISQVIPVVVTAQNGTTKTYSVSVTRASGADAQIISNNIPTVMKPGQQYPVTITVKNTGNQTWTNDIYHLGTTDGSKTFAYMWQAFQEPTIAPGQSTNFTFTMTAPSTPGSYVTAWRMNLERGGWFGQTLTVNVSVTADNQGPSQFVTRFYEQCLNREPDAGGLSYWSNQLVSGQKTGADVAYGFVFSPEFAGKNVSNSAYLDVLYQAFFNRTPDSGGKAYWLSQLSGGTGRLNVLAGFVNSPEFASLCSQYGITPGKINT